MAARSQVCLCNPRLELDIHLSNNRGRKKPLALQYAEGQGRADGGIYRPRRNLSSRGSNSISQLLSHSNILLKGFIGMNEADAHANLS